MRNRYINFIMAFLVVVLLGGDVVVAEYDVQMGQKNQVSNEWDDYYPITKARNVKMNDGLDIESFLEGFSRVPKRSVFGGQLERLKYSLSNPLEQFTGIVFIGDSITWGRALNENSIIDPRDGTLSDARDNFNSPSFVNNFKKYIGKKYAYGASPVLSNWSASQSGESITTYEREIKLYPYGGDFKFATTGNVVVHTSRSSAKSILGHQIVTTINSGSDGEAILSFPFTGDSFTLSFDSVKDISMNYELFVDGVSQGVFTTAPDGITIVAGYDNRRTHSFDYIRNKTIEIKSRKTSYVGNQALYLGGVIVNKKIRITNQGIIGATSKTYLEKNLVGNANGDGEAVGDYDNYVFCQFGSNDRTKESHIPGGSNEFKKNLNKLINALTPLTEVILMAPSPATNENPLAYTFNMQDVRNVVYRLAKENALDMIDNYSCFDGIDNMNSMLTDGLHPNKLGHQVIFKNIVNSLELK